MATRMTLRSKVCVMAWTGMLFLAVVLAGGMRMANSAAVADEAGKAAVANPPAPPETGTGVITAKAAEEPEKESAVATIRDRLLNPNGQPTRQAVISGWQVESLSLAGAGGRRKTISGSSGAISLILAKNTFVLRARDKVLLDATYILDPTNLPCTIKVTSKDGGMHGLCELEGDRLKIALNDNSHGLFTDINANGWGLILVLRRYEASPLWVIDADGTNPHEFYAPSGSAHCGSAAWSRDGSKLVFDSIHRLFGEQFPDSQIIVVDATGGQPKEVRHGVLANWSPDGKKIAFCSYEAPHQGVCIMNADGSDVQSIDPRGWGIVWSPTRDELAYLEGANLCIYDSNTHERRHLLNTSYRNISFGFTWSSDGDWICFRGDSEKGQEVVVVHRDGEEKGLRVLLSIRTTPGLKEIGGFLGWEPKPDGRIVASMAMAGNPNRQLYFLDSEGNTPPKRLAEQDPTRPCMSPAWSPDGKRIVSSVRPAVSQ